MLRNVSALINALNDGAVRYCHWKSNAALSEALSGLTDVDLLIDRHDADAFRAAAAQCAFRPAQNGSGTSLPSAEHYFGFDTETGRLAHIHAYYRVITGESLAKNFHLPIEEMLLENTRLDGVVRVPTKAAELVVFTVRMMLKHTTAVELVLLARDWNSLQKESSSLIDPISIAESIQLVDTWLPSIDNGLFPQCVASLQAPGAWMRRLALARKMRSRLQMYARRSRLVASWTGIWTFLRMAARRILRRPHGLTLRSGGALVAFVGPEATGKSTLITEVSDWLGEHFEVDCVHAGKPQSTLFTVLPNLVLPVLRRLAPTLRATEVEKHCPTRGENRSLQWIYPITFAVRAVMLAYERRALLSRAFGRTANGTIVLCDRYPYVAPEAPDGPRLMHFPLPDDRYPIRHLLAAVERRLYSEIPRPDLIIALTTPVEVAVARNRQRGKQEPEDYVRWRHSAAQSPPHDKTLLCSIDTNRALDKTLLDVKSAIWGAL